MIYAREQAIVSWGVAEFQEGTRGTNPEGTQIIGNYAHEIGLLEKQVAHQRVAYVACYEYYLRSQLLTAR